LTGVGFRRGAKLLRLDPNNRHNKVGRDRGKCRFSPRKEKVKCPCRHSLNGEIGGVGNIRPPCS